MEKIEVWKELYNFDGAYLISNTGKVWSKKSNRELTLTTNGTGYQKITLSHNSKSTNLYIHRLVGEHFVEGKSSVNCQINHIDGDSMNNNYRNLEWVTPIENWKDAVEKGRRFDYFGKGKKDSIRKKVDKVNLEGNVIKTYQSIGEASRENGLTHNIVSRACRNKKSRAKNGFYYKYTKDMEEA